MFCIEITIVILSIILIGGNILPLRCQDSTIKRIFGTMINQKLQDFEEDVKPIGDLMTQGTLEVYQAVVTRFLPTPAKIHYLFNMRDISKVSIVWQCFWQFGIVTARWGSYL